MTTLTIDNAEEVVKEAFWLAWNACGGPMGMGVFQDNGGASRDDVWSNVQSNGDYPGPAHSRDGEANGDYVFGRMMKLYVEYTDNTIEVNESTPTPGYQAWCTTYKTYGDLFSAAVASLEQVGHGE